MNFFTWRVLSKRIRAIGPFLRDKSVRKIKKALVIFCIVYLFLPIDLIPPAVPVLGFVDDIVLWMCVIYYLRDELDTYWLGEKKTDYSKEYKETINAEYTRKEDDGEK